MTDQQYDNVNKGVLFIQQDKKTPSHPDLKGNINIDGKEYWLSGWSNTSASGKKYLKLSVQAKDDTYVPKQPVSQGSVAKAINITVPVGATPTDPRPVFTDDEIPF